MGIEGTYKGVPVFGVGFTPKIAENYIKYVTGEEATGELGLQGPWRSESGRTSYKLGYVMKLGKRAVYWVTEGKNKGRKMAMLENCSRQIFCPLPEGLELFWTACHICGKKPPIYRVAKLAFCSKHRVEAMQENKKTRAYYYLKVGQKQAVWDETEKNLRIKDSMIHQPLAAMRQKKGKKQ